MPTSFMAYLAVIFPSLNTRRFMLCRVFFMREREGKKAKT